MPVALSKVPQVMQDDAWTWEEPFFLPLPKEACPFFLSPVLLHLQFIYNCINMSLFQINWQRITIRQIRW